jgi:vitamin B12 transporter
MQTDGLTGGRESSVYRKILCLCAALTCAHAWAQDVPTLDEVVVTATRVDSTILDSPSSISVISARQIADSGATDVSQVINGQPGVEVKDYGAEGATKSVSVRGSTSSQVLVLLDGIRLNSSRDGEVDLSSIPIEMVDHIEIVRGGESALYGSSAIGGVVNIITKKAEKPAISLSLTNESYIPHAANSVDEVLQPFPQPPTYPQTAVAANPMDLLDGQNVDLSLQGKLGAVGLIGGGSFVRAANGFTWNDTTGINAWRRRNNADALAASGYAGISALFLGGELSAKGIFQASDTGVPGSLTTISQTARQDAASASAAAAWKTGRFLADALTLDLKGFYRYSQLGYNDPAYPPASLHQTHTASFDATQKLTLSDWISAVYGGNVSYDYAQSTNFAAPHDRLDVAGFLSLPVTLFDMLTISLSGRYDYFSDFPGSPSGSLSAVLRLSDVSSLRASFGSAYRVPALNDLYWYDPSGFTAANPNLRPETSYSAELGWALLRKELALDASVFVRQLFDNIIWLYDPAVGPFGTYLPENLTRTLTPGAELHAKAAVTDTISVEMSYTFLYSLLLNDGTSALTLADNRRVPYSPMHSVAAGARYAGKIIGLGVDLRYMSEQFTDTANSASAAMPGYFLANADFRFSAGNSIAFTLGLKNLFNALYYTQLGYPMPPFSFVTGVNVKL